MASRKDYVATARIVSNISNESTRTSVAMDFVVLYREDNPRFNIARFLTACNVKQA